MKNIKRDLSIEDLFFLLNRSFIVIQPNNYINGRFKFIVNILSFIADSLSDIVSDQKNIVNDLPEVARVETRHALSLQMPCFHPCLFPNHYP